MDDPKSNRKLVLPFLLCLSSIYFPAGFLCQRDDPNHAITCEQPFQCANILNLTYPFWDVASLEENSVYGKPGNDVQYASNLLLCGHPDFGLNCRGNVPVINISTILYRVLQIDFFTHTLKVARQDLWDDTCSPILVDTILDSASFETSPNSNYENVTLYYNCSGRSPSSLPMFSCDKSEKTTAINLFRLGNNASAGPGDNYSCKQQITVPVNQSAVQAAWSLDALHDALATGFPIQWSADDAACQRCSGSGGECRYKVTSGEVSCESRVKSSRPGRKLQCSINRCKTSRKCTYSISLGDFYCDRIQPNPPATSPAPSFPPDIPPDPPGIPDYPPPKPNSRSSYGKIRIIIGLVFGAIGFTLASILICWYCKTKHFPRDVPLKIPNIEKFLQEHGSLAPKRYKYSEIKKLTNSFNDKLGQGGYGSVYKGVMHDGRPVALKVLIEIDSNDEEFINEVASISRTSHINVVGLLGFCYERNKRALVYEFMINRSLDKFFRDSNTSLDVENLYKIAIGVAKGLEYLHSGCSTRIIHFDIKPQNILLDEDFCPKISDFGLAKLCKKKQSVLSTLGTRGTIGYIAPEVFCRNFRGISHKSDVYSYGMMILEMVGASEWEVGTAHSSESYFTDKIYEWAIPSHGTEIMDCDSSMVHVKDERLRKMFLVGFWCIQIMPADRPSMTKVIEMFEGNVESIQIPPKPILFNPTTLGHEISPVHDDVETEDSTECGSALIPTS